MDVGISTERVDELLQSSPIVTIVGYQGSGKSRLAEILDERLSGSRKVLMQTASAWFQRASAAGSGSPGATFDPEIFRALQELGRERESCWIVDDAEVMFAYATERALASLGERLEPRRFSLVLIRNRFVLEDEGWFHQRQSLVAHNIPTLAMRPLPPDDARQEAERKFPRAATRALQAEWLASMSGGVPGLMQTLYRYTPDFAPAGVNPKLLDFVAMKRAELELDRPMRRLLVDALGHRVLPPIGLLSDQARTELGVMLIAGMVSASYARGGDPFHGEFWRLVAGQNGHREQLAESAATLALNLESIFEDAGVADDLRQACGIETNAAGALAQAFAANMTCALRYAPLVRPLAPMLIEVLGRLGLRDVLATAGEAPPRGMSADEMIEILFAKASS